MAMALTEVYSTGLSGTNGYLKCILLFVKGLIVVILWAIAGLAAFRFIGSTTYLLVNMIQRIARSKSYAKFSDA
jgi:chitin synthase